MFTSRAYNIPHDSSDNPPRLVMYVNRRAAKRHKAIMTIAKTIRNQSKNSVQTTITIGKRDFLLRQRPRGSSTPWAEIPPLTITQNIPDFEIGNYTDIINPANNLEEDNNAQMDDEDINNVIRDLSNHNDERIEPMEDPLKLDNNKRDRSQTINEQNKKTHQMTNSHISIDNSKENQDTKDESSPKEVMNSTPIPDEPEDNPILSKSLQEEAKYQKEITYYKSYPNTPYPHNHPTRINLPNSIPETPENSNINTNTMKKTTMRNKLISRKITKDPTMDSQAINDLFNDAQGQTLQYE